MSVPTSRICVVCPATPAMYRPQVVPPVVGSQYKAVLANSRLDILDGYGHYVEYEDPARIASLISGFAA